MVDRPARAHVPPQRFDIGNLRRGRRVLTDVRDAISQALRAVVACSAALFVFSMTIAGGAWAGQAKDEPASPAWKDKQVSEWTEADAKQLLADSPWTKSVTPTTDKPLEKNAGPSGTRKRFGIGGLGIGRRSAASDTASADNRSSNSTPSPNSQSSSATSSSSSSASAEQSLPTLKLRWESALPVREAELKSHDTAALAVDENHYGIAVYGVPGRMVKDDSKKLIDRLKAQAAIKRAAKEDIKPSAVEIRVREDGPVILYLFPRTEEITWRDHEIEFDAQIGPLKFKQSFQSDDMRFHGTLEL